MTPLELGWLAARIAFLLTLIALLLVESARAHDHGQFGQYSEARDQWLRQQTNPKTSMHCCTQADASLVEEDIREGAYWIRWGQFDWVRVPDNAVLPYPNPRGEPVVWWAPQWKDNKMSPLIRCYSPGSGI